MKALNSSQSCIFPHRNQSSDVCVEESGCRYRSTTVLLSTLFYILTLSVECYWNYKINTAGEVIKAEYGTVLFAKMTFYFKCMKSSVPQAEMWNIKCLLHSLLKCSHYGTQDLHE